MCQLARAGSLGVNTNSRTCPDSEFLMLRAQILIDLTAVMILKQLVHGFSLGISPSCQALSLPQHYRAKRTEATKEGHGLCSISACD